VKSGKFRREMETKTAFFISTDRFPRKPYISKPYGFERPLKAVSEWVNQFRYT
jgi:hypothetical protein